MRSNRIGMKLGLIIARLFYCSPLPWCQSISNVFKLLPFRNENRDHGNDFSCLDHGRDHRSIFGRNDADLRRFSNVSMFYINRGDITFHTGEHNPADRTFIRKEDLKKIFSGKAINLEHEDPLGHRYMVIGQPIHKDHQITSAIYVMASMQSMDKSLTAIRNLLMLSGVGAFC